MTQRRLHFLVLLAIVFTIGLSANNVFAAEEVTTQSLNAQNRSSLKITPVHEERVTSDIILQDTITPTATGEFVLRRKSIIGLDPLTLFDGTNVQDVVQMSGRTEPYAFVTLHMRAENNPHTEVTRANKNGRWQIIIAVDFLTPGEHTASIQTSVNGIHSDEMEVGRFTVEAHDSVSNSTWVFIGCIGLAILLLLVATTLQIRQQRKAVEQAMQDPEGKV